MLERVEAAKLLCDRLRERANMTPRVSWLDATSLVHWEGRP